MLFSSCSRTLNGSDSMISFGEPLKHVITLRGPFMASRKLAIRDEPNIGLRRSSARIRGDILIVHTRVSACHTAHTHTPQTPHALPHTTYTTSHGDRQRETQREKTEIERDKRKTRRNFDFSFLGCFDYVDFFSIFVFYVFEFLDFLFLDLGVFVLIFGFFNFVLFFFWLFFTGSGFGIQIQIWASLELNFITDTALDFSGIHSVMISVSMAL